MNKPLKPKGPSTFVRTRDPVSLTILNDADSDELTFVESDTLSDMDNVSHRTSLTVADLVKIVEKLKQPGMENVCLLGEEDCYNDVTDGPATGFKLEGFVERSAENIQQQKDTIARMEREYKSSLAKYEEDMVLFRSQERVEKGHLPFAVFIKTARQLDTALTFEGCVTKQDLEAVLIRKEVPETSVLYILLESVPNVRR